MWASALLPPVHGFDSRPVYSKLLTSRTVAQVFQPAGSGDFPVARWNGGLESPPNPQSGKTAPQPAPRHSAICNLKSGIQKGTLLANDRTKIYSADENKPETPVYYRHDKLDADP